MTEPYYDPNVGLVHEGRNGFLIVRCDYAFGQQRIKVCRAIPGSLPDIEREL